MESAHKETMLNLKETELRLGLPGSLSPDRTELCLLGRSKSEEKSQTFLTPFKGFASRSKRVFLDTVGLGGDLTISTNPVTQDGYATNCGMNTKSLADGGVDHTHPSVNSPRANNSVGKSSAINSSKSDEEATAKERKHQSKALADDSSIAHVAKAQVVGWPPIRSYMKNTMAINPPKINGESSVKPSAQCMYVKVSMDGAPYLRKIDLINYRTYRDLSTALEKMFICFTLGQCSSHGGPEVDEFSENKVVDLLHGAECVLTYEDKDGDWMLVGDVPWEMFIVSCKRLRIMKGSEAIGLVPGALEKCAD